MSTSTAGAGAGAGADDDSDSPDLLCQLDCVQGMVDALSSLRWKRHQVSSSIALHSTVYSLPSPSSFIHIYHLSSSLFIRYQDALLELSPHGIVIIVEESGCLQAKVYLKRELFLSYDYAAQGRPRFGLSLGLLIDCLNIFSAPANASVIEIQYPGPDMQLLFKSVGSPDSCLYAEIRTRIPDTISWDYHFEHSGTTPLTFTVKSAILKEAIDDLDWPGSAIQVTMQPDPPMVIFRGEGHGDLQIEFPYYANTDLLISFQCERHISCRYKYKFLRATTANFPSSVLKENRGSKVTIGRGGMLKIQHLVSVAKPVALNLYTDAQPSRIAYIEFFVKPEEEEVHS